MMMCALTKYLVFLGFLVIVSLVITAVIEGVRGKNNDESDY